MSAVMNNVALRCELSYNIASGLLTGRVDGIPIHANAGSGGRAGSKTPGAENWWLANNPLATRVKLNAAHTNIGGPLPMGRYSLSLHETRPNWIRLTPAGPHRLMHGRAGFAIHGRGLRGSDGCIVPTDFSNVRLLCRLIAARDQSGAYPICLEVVAIGQNLDAKLYTA